MQAAKIVRAEGALGTAGAGVAGLVAGVDSHPRAYAYGCRRGRAAPAHALLSERKNHEATIPDAHCDVKGPTDLIATPRAGSVTRGPMRSLRSTIRCS